MPSLLIVGESGIGKTQLDLKFCRDHPSRLMRKICGPSVPWSAFRCRRQRQIGCFI
jgi:hypothetical protein